MMKKILVGAVLVGVVAGTYFIIKDIKKGNVSSKLQKDNSSNNLKTVENDAADNSEVIEEIYGAKSNSAQDVYERHSEAASIMVDAFKNIMETVEPIDNDVESGAAIIEDNDVETIHELDSLSDELDELLK